MPRKRVEENILNTEPIEARLKVFIDRYGKNKTELDKLKKAVDDDNKLIKDIMLKEGKKVAVSDYFTASCSISKRTSVDEEKLLETIKESGYTNLIKTKEYVDSDLLESAIYHDEIDGDTLDAISRCNIVKEVVVLKVKEN